MKTGDSLARSARPNGDFQHGYAERLLALLQQDPSLRLEKLACGGAPRAGEERPEGSTS